MEEEPNGDEAVVVDVGDPKMEGDFAAVEEVAPPPKIDPDVTSEKFLSLAYLLRNFTPTEQAPNMLLLIYD